MSREIKFRAWHKALKRMYKEDEVLPWLHSFIKMEYVGILQYTGLKDKNGKEIYEGDIVNYTEWESLSSEDGTDYNETLYTGVIYYDIDLAQFLIADSSNPCEPWSDDEHLEVIGNIYENKELMKNDM